MEIWNDTQWWVELVFNVCLFVLPTLAGFATTGALGWRTIRITRRVWTVIRSGVDDATDPAILFLAAQSGKSSTAISKFLVATGDQIISLLPEESAPQGG